MCRDKFVNIDIENSIKCEDCKCSFLNRVEKIVEKGKYAFYVKFLICYNAFKCGNDGLKKMSHKL